MKALENILLKFMFRLKLKPVEMLKLERPPWKKQRSLPLKK